MRQTIRLQAKLIGLGFAALLLAMVGMSVDAGLSFYRVHKELSGVLEGLADEQLLAQQLRTELQQLRRFEKDVQLNVSRLSLAQDYYQKWQGAYLRTQELLHDMTSLASRAENPPAYLSPKIVREMQDELQSYQVIFQQAYAELPDAQNRSRERLWTELARGKLGTYALDEVLLEVVEQSERVEQAELVKAKQSRDRALWRLGVLSALLTLGGVALAVFVTRRSLVISRGLDHGAKHDPLTRLLNRRGLEGVVTEQLTQGGQLLYVDLDKYKLVNDICGHVVGDDLLVELAQVMAEICQPPAVLARVGGDEFVIWMPHATAEAARRLGEQLVDSVRHYSFSWQGREFALGASVGFSGTGGEIDYRELLSRADAACFLSKRDRLGVVKSFEDNAVQLQQVQQEQVWASRIPHLLNEGRFVLFAQRIVSLQAAGPTVLPRVEILLRARDEDLSLISPGQFLPAAERYGLMSRIDRWVIEHVFHEARNSGLSLAINLSAQTMTDPRFLPELEALIERSGIAPHQICFEITESAAMTNMETTRSYIERLRAQGCRFALDDFGSGFSSFAYLKTLRVDYLKIDGSLIRNIETSAEDSALVHAIVQMAKALGLETVAEFVESPAQASMLTGLGVTYGQGYALHRPQPLAELLSLGQSDVLA